MTARRHWLLFVILVLSAVAMARPAVAEIVNSPIAGTFNEPQENGCVFVSVYYYRVDCSYSRLWPAVAERTIPWVGPTRSSVYYRLASAHAVPSYTPVAGDDRIPLNFNGSIAIDDRGTVEPVDDTLSAVLVVESAARNSQTRARAKGAPLIRVVESWRSLTHRMIATAVNGVMPNASGGWDYVIAEKGLPPHLCAAKAENGCFPSANAPDVAEGKWSAGYWAQPVDVGLTRSRLLDGNSGATTTVEIEGYRCQAQVAGDACQSGFGLWGAATGRGVSNLLLRVSTNRQRRVTAVTGFWTMEYRLDAGPATIGGEHGEDNSWYGGLLTARGVETTAPQRPSTNSP